jgi:outer membrane protein
MKVIRIICFLLLLAKAPFGLFAQSDSVMRFSLKEAQDYAIQNFYVSKNAKLDIEKAKKVVMETRAIGLPQISVSGSYQYTPTVSPIAEQFSGLGNLGPWMYSVDSYIHSIDPGNNNFGHITDPGPPEQIDPKDLKWSFSGSLTASQLIFNGSYLVALQSVKVYKRLSELSLSKSEIDVSEAVKNAYLNVLIARENKAILDSTYNNMVKTLTELKAIGKQGLIDMTDVDQMQLTVTNIKTSLDFVTRMSDIAEKLFIMQLGANIDTHVILSDSLAQFVNEQAYDNLLLADFVLDNNVDYKMLNTNVKAQELLLKLKKSEYLPVIAGYYQYYNEFNDKAFSINPPHVIGATVSIPIFASGSKLAKVSQAKIDLMKAQNNSEQLANAIKLDYYNSRSALIAARDNYASSTQNLELAKKILKNSNIKYSNGLISSTDLTQIQNQYLTAQSNYFSSLQGLVVATNKLEKLLSKSEN